jgi:hypothetical protein
MPIVSATCSLGASPLEMTANAKPGQIVEIKWNFFNLRGDRPTHVLVSKSEGPDWKVEYEPKAEIKQYEVSGVITDSEENFVMSRSEIVQERPEILPSGKKAYIVHPDSSKGYILVDEQMKIYITIPDNAEIGKQEDFVFEALGKCFGETGAVSASLATELKVNIRTTTEYYEKPLEEEVKEEEIGKKFISLFSGGGEELSQVHMIITGTTLILAIIFIVLLVIAKGKFEKKAKKRK